MEAEKDAIRAITEKLPYSNLSLDYFKNTPMQEIFDSPKWEELYKPCLACGTCTFVIARPASAMTSAIMTPEKESADSTAGIPACIPTLP